MSEVAISVSHVSKMYKLYDRPMDRLKESLGLSRTKKYREHFALQDVSFEIRRGETLGIIGINGAGKSTILKIITGVLNQTAGDVAVNGRISALLELGAGFNMEYSGLENVYLNGTMSGFSKEEIDSKLDAILNFADIGDFIHQPVKTYSSGMFVRLAFAVAINIDPDILIVDEALSVGDVFFQTKCYHKFNEFKKMGKTLLFVSHDLGSINKYCDRVVLLNKGTKLAEGKPREMIDLFKQVLVGHTPTGNQEKRLDVQEISEKEVQGQDAEIVVSQKDTEEEQWKRYMLLNPQVQSYGDEQAEIVDFGIFDKEGKISNTIYKMESFSLRMMVAFHATIKDPIFAFSIKDLKGNELCGTNTVIEQVETGTVNAGRVIEIGFIQKMILQGGQYMVQLGCTGYENDNLVVHHRLYDICSIQVLADKTTVGYFDLDSRVVYDNGY